MRPTRFCILALALTVQACDGITEPEDDFDAPQLTVQSDLMNATFPKYEVDPPRVPELPPVERQPTFWTCAAEAEGQFAALVIRIIQLEVQALWEPDPYRQAVLLAEVARLKHEAKKALWFALEQCVATYGAPRLFALPDENGNLVFQPFSVGALHGYYVALHLEKPE